MERKDKDLMVSADAVTEAEKEGKKKLRKEQWKNFWQKGFMLIVIIILIILLLAKCDSGGFRLPDIYLPGSEKVDKFSTEVDENAQGDSLIGKSKEEIQKALNEKSKGNRLTMNGNPSVVLVDGNSLANLNIINNTIGVSNMYKSTDRISLLKDVDNYKKIITVYNVPLKVNEEGGLSAVDDANALVLYTSSEMGLEETLDEEELKAFLKSHGLNEDLRLYSQKTLLFEKDCKDTSPENALHIFGFMPIKCTKVSESNNRVYLVNSKDDYKKIVHVYKKLPENVSIEEYLEADPDGDSYGELVYTSSEMNLDEILSVPDLTTSLSANGYETNVNLYSQKVLLFDNNTVDSSVEDALYVFDNVPMNASFELEELKDVLEITRLNSYPQVIQCYVVRTDAEGNEVEGELLYQSGLIPVGTTLPNVKFDIHLDKGTYKVVEYFNAVDYDGTLKGKQRAIIKVEVLK